MEDLPPVRMEIIATVGTQFLAGRVLTVRIDAFARLTRRAF